MARKKKKVNTSNTKNLNHEIKGIIFITIGLLLIFGIYYSNAGFVGRVSKTLVFSLLGLLGYILPMLLIAYGIYIIAAQGKITSKKRLYGILIFLINTLLFIQMLTFEEYYQPESLMNSLKGIIYSQSRFHGGILGFLVDLPFYKLFGVVGSFIIFSALYVISTIVLFDISIYDMGESVRSKAKESRKKIKSNVSKDELPEKAITKELEPINPEEKSEYIKGINNKIKILDFMKNNSIVEEEKSDIVINDTPEDLNKKVSSPPTDKNINEEVNKEISEKIINMPEDVKYEFPPLDLLNINSNTKMNKEDKKELLSYKFAFRPNQKEAQKKVLEFFGMDTNPANIQLINELKSGTCLFQDHRGRSQPIAIDVLFDSWLMAVSSTNKEDEATQMALAMEQGS